MSYNYENNCVQTLNAAASVILSCITHSDNNNIFI